MKRTHPPHVFSQLALSLRSMLTCVLVVVFAISALGDDSPGSPEQRTYGRVIQLQRHRFGAKGLITQFGTAWCLDAGCSLWTTNYHVAKVVAPTKIWGAKIVGLYLATGPEDNDAVWLPTTYGQWLRFNPLRDVALLALARPLAPATPAPVFATDKLTPGEEALVYAHPGGKRVALPLRFMQVTGGLLEFSMSYKAAGGLSGGMVTDKRGQILGMMSGIVEDHALVVPVWSIADALRRFLPELYAKLFPAGVETPPEFHGSSSLSPELKAALGGLSPAPILSAAYLEEGLGEPFAELPPRPMSLTSSRDEPTEIGELRRRARAMWAGIANLAALETLRFKAANQRQELVWMHELSVVSDRLVFRSIDDGQQSDKIEFPRRRAVIPGAEWRELPRMVGGEPKLRFEEVGMRAVEGHRFRIFRYQAAAEDGVCFIRYRQGNVLSAHDDHFQVACRGEVWTDSELNIVRITQELEIPKGKTAMRVLQLSMLYGWFDRELVPVDMLVRATIAGRPCTAQAHFSNYRRLQGNKPDG